MKIYEYSHSGDFKKIKYGEIEVEEKNKIYVSKGGSWRTNIKKSEIGKINGLFYKNMYLTERDDERYINTLIDYQKGKIKRIMEQLAREETALNNLLKHKKAEREAD